MALRGRPAIYVTVISVRSPIGAELGCKHARLCSREARTWGGERPPHLSLLYSSGPNFCKVGNSVRYDMEIDTSDAIVT
jgi:hypothetical protein